MEEEQEEVGDMEEGQVCLNKKGAAGRGGGAGAG